MRNMDVVPGLKAGRSGLLPVAGELFEHRRHLGASSSTGGPSWQARQYCSQSASSSTPRSSACARSSPSTSMPWLASRQARRLAIASSTASDSACVPKVA
jgi:hypothetical protein